MDSLRQQLIALQTLSVGWHIFRYRHCAEFFLTTHLLYYYIAMRDYTRNQLVRRMELMEEMNEPATERTTRDCPPAGVRVRNCNNEYDEW